GELADGSLDVGRLFLRGKRPGQADGEGRGREHGGEAFHSSPPNREAPVLHSRFRMLEDLPGRQPAATSASEEDTAGTPGRPAKNSSTAARKSAGVASAEIRTRRARPLGSPWVYQPVIVRSLCRTS